MSADGLGHPALRLRPLRGAQRAVLDPVAGFVRGQRQLGQAALVDALVPGRVAVPAEPVGRAQRGFCLYAVGRGQVREDQPVPHVAVVLRGALRGVGIAQQAVDRGQLAPVAHGHVPPVAGAIQIGPAEAAARLILDQHGGGVGRHPAAQVLDPAGRAGQRVVRQPVRRQPVQPPLRQVHGVKGGQHGGESLDLHPGQIERTLRVLHQRQIQRQHVRQRPRPRAARRLQLRLQRRQQVRDLGAQRLVQGVVADPVVIRQQALRQVRRTDLRQRLRHRFHPERFQSKLWQGAHHEASA